MERREDEHPIARAFHESLQRWDQDLDELRAACASVPGDLARRARLLGALCHPGGRPELSEQLVEEVVWWIRSHPHELRYVEHALSTLTSAPYFAYVRIREAWEVALAAQGDEPEVALAAAESFAHHEPERALALLERAHAALPQDSRPAREAAAIWWQRSARFGRLGEPGRDRATAAEASRWFERALERESDPGLRGVVLLDACEAALGVGDRARGRTWAEELLALAAARPRSWMTGNAIYSGHSVLGRIALEEGSIDRAKEHLAHAGRTPGSPQLDSFGPDLGLAEALLSKGEREAVADFLREISRFWRSGRGRIEAWCEAIARGETPALSRFDFD